jgi:hypothetical protein
MIDTFGASRRALAFGGSRFDLRDPSASPSP